MACSDDGCTGGSLSFHLRHAADLPFAHSSSLRWWLRYQPESSLRTGLTYGIIAKALEISPANVMAKYDAVLMDPDNRRFHA
jgi:hypothetical protein